MGKREQLQPQLQHESNAHPPMHRLSAAVTIVLAAALFAFGAVLPNWLLHRRSAKYFSTTAQVSISDIHPYGDQYESMKQSLQNTIRYRSTMSGQEWSVGPDGNDIVDNINEESDEESNLILADSLSSFDHFLTVWNTALGEEGYGVVGLEMLGYDNTVLLSSQDNAQPDALMINATDYSSGNSMLASSELLLNCSTGAPVYMHLVLFSWDDPTLEILWTCLLSAYRDQLGIQFTEVSSTDAGAVKGGAETSNVEEKQFSALSADQVFRLDAFLQMESSLLNTDDDGVTYQIQVELTAEE